MPLALISFKFLIFNLSSNDIWKRTSNNKKNAQHGAFQYGSPKNLCHELIFNFPPTPLKMELRKKRIFTVNMGRWWCLPSRIYNYFARRERSINYFSVDDARRKKYQISSHCNLLFLASDTWQDRVISEESNLTRWHILQKKRFLS